MERKIGEIFEYQGKKLIVEESNSGGCGGCFFKELCPLIVRKTAGECQAESRVDNKHVIFVEVKEQKETKAVKERKIGEKFEYDGKTLEVVETKYDTCYLCCFKENDGRCSKNKSKVGECEMIKRSDRRPVIFVEVKDKTKEQPQQTEKPKELKIGETFEYKGRKLKAIEKEGIDDCDGCVLFKEDCKRVHDLVGECEGKKRNDGKGVVFVDVDEFDDYPLIEEEPQQLNLCEILKNCPMGESFWSPLYGDVKLYCIDQEAEKVVVTAVGNVNRNINSDATITFGNMRSPEIMLYPSREQRDWSKVKYEPKNVLPRTWEEFCVTHNITMSEYFIGNTGNIFNSNSGKRIPEISKTILPSEQAAEAHLAYMQLHQLRNAWREGWVPDWTDNTQAKFAIIYNKDEYIVFDSRFISRFLSFQDESRAKEFLKCYKGLIKKAMDLI